LIDDVSKFSLTSDHVNLFFTACEKSGSIYDSRSNLVELAAMVYWLSTGISFDIARETLKRLKEQEPELFISGRGKRFMLLLSAQDD
jgi:hypothetical protein